MPNWDLFHADRLEVEPNLTAAQIRERVASGALRPDDLVRPAGSTEAWKRVGDLLGVTSPPPASVPSAPASAPAPSPTAPAGPSPGVPNPVLPHPQPGRSAIAGVAPVLGPAITSTRRADAPLAAASAGDDDENAMPAALEEPLEHDPLAEDAEAANFTFAARGGREKEEDLDLAAMVDVAFQLILFFLVTASTVFFKSVEIPPPDPEKAKSAQQSVARSIQDLQNDNILVEIDARGQFLVDHEPVDPDLLASKMRAIRESTGRLAMLLMADRATPHKYVVRALDAATEIGVAIKVGRASSSE